MSEIKPILLSLVSVLRLGKKTSEFESKLLTFKLPHYIKRETNQVKELYGLPNPFYEEENLFNDIADEKQGSPEESYHLLKRLLYICYDLHNKPAGENEQVAAQSKEIEVLKIILEKWNKSGDYIEMIAEQARLGIFEFCVLKYICRLFGNQLSIYKILNKIMAMKVTSKSIGFSLAINRLVSIYGDLDVIIWNNLLKDAESLKLDDDGEIINCLKSKIRSMAPIATKPKWVNILDGETCQTILSTTGGQDQRSTADMAADLATKMTEQFSLVKENGSSVKPDDIKGEIENLISTATTDEFNVISRNIDSLNLKAVNESKSEEIKYTSSIERIWGPANAVTGRNCHFAPSRIGPCRMLYCSCDEYDPETPDNFLDNESWFKGSCEACYQKIGNISYAVRKPLIEGTWSGCFCSFSCLLKDITNPIEKELVGTIEKVIKVYGILDRKLAK